MSLARSTTTLLRPSVGRLASAANSRRTFTTATADKIPIASAADERSKTTAITVALKAGPRYETKPGVAHLLKNFTFKSNASRSALALIREAELYGGVLSSTLTKEHLLLTAEFLRGDEEYFVEVLGEVLSSSKFAPHEFNEEVLPAVQGEYEQALTQPHVLGFDVLAQTAYRQRGLGASLFASPNSPVSHADVVAFANSTFTQDNMSVVGSGIDTATLSKLVSRHFKGVRPSGSVTAGSKQYFGGDARVPYAPPHSAEGARAHYGHYLIAFEGAGLDASPELSVLRSHLGGESSVKWSSGLSPLSKISESVQGAQATAFNIAFSDSGLIGAYITAPHAKLTEAAKAAAQAMKQAASSISKEDLAKAKAKARFEAATALESRAGVHAAVGGQLLNSNKVQQLEETFSKIESVTASAVSSAAGKALSSKPTAVAVGDVYQLPYVDQLL